MSAANGSSQITWGYRIARWTELYEPPKNDQPRNDKYAPLKFAKWRIEGHAHDLSGDYRDLMEEGRKDGQEYGPAAFGLFGKLLELAGNEPTHRRDGTLYSHRGARRGMPATEEDISFYSLFSPELVSECLRLLVDVVGWVERFEITAQCLEELDERDVHAARAQAACKLHEAGAQAACKVSGNGARTARGNHSPTRTETETRNMNMNNNENENGAHARGAQSACAPPDSGSCAPVPRDSVSGHAGIQQTALVQLRDILQVPTVPNSDKSERAKQARADQTTLETIVKGAIASTDQAEARSISADLIETARRCADRRGVDNPISLFVSRAKKQYPEIQFGREGVLSGAF